MMINILWLAVNNRLFDEPVDVAYRYVGSAWGFSSVKLMCEKRRTRDEVTI